MWSQSNPNLVTGKLGFLRRKKYRIDFREEKNKCPLYKELRIVILVVAVGT